MGSATHQAVGGRDGRRAATNRLPEGYDRRERNWPDAMGVAGAWWRAEGDVRSWWRRVNERRSAGDAGLPGSGARHPAGAGDWPVAGTPRLPGVRRAPATGTRDQPASDGDVDQPAASAATEPVPDPGLPRIGFIGAGHVGTALGVALRRAGWPVTAVASRDPGRRDRFVDLVPGTHGFAEPPAVLDEVDLVFVTVPDDAIAGIASQLRLYSGQAIVHTSGVLPASVLAPAMAAGTEAGSFHPLVAFADLDAALAALPGATVAIEGDEPLIPLLGDLAGALGARAVRVTAAGKPLHHAAAVLAAGGLVALLDTIAQLGAVAGLDEEEALRTYGGLARQGLDNAARLGIGAALTGPVVRGDLGTVRAHLDALRRLAPDVLPVYLALGRRTVALAVARGELGPESAAELLTLLAPAG